MLVLSLESSDRTTTRTARTKSSITLSWPSDSKLLPFCLNHPQPHQEQRQQHRDTASIPPFRYLFSLDDYFVGPLTLRDSPLAICTLGSFFVEAPLVMQTVYSVRVPARITLALTCHTMPFCLAFATVFMQTCTETPPLTLAPKEIAAHCWVPLDFFTGGSPASPTASSASLSSPALYAWRDKLPNGIRQRLGSCVAEELPRILDVDASRTTNFPAWIGAMGPWPGLALPVALDTGGSGGGDNLTSKIATATDSRFFLWGLTLSLTASCLSRLGHPRLQERLSAPRYVRAPLAFRFVARTRIAAMVEAHRWQQMWQGRLQKRAPLELSSKL